MSWSKVSYSGNLFVYFFLNYICIWHENIDSTRFYYGAKFKSNKEELYK